MSRFVAGQFWYWTDKAEKANKPALRVRVIRVASHKRKNDVWLVTNVLDASRLTAASAARLDRMRWESECFFKTSKRVVKDIRLVSRTTTMVVREAEGSLLACQLLLAQGASALKVAARVRVGTRTSAAPPGCCGRSGGSSRRAPSRCRRRASRVGGTGAVVIGGRGPASR